MTRSIGQLGRDIRTARLRRRLRAAVVAERAQISLPTLARVERGEVGVSLGIYATVLWALGLLDPLAGIASPAQDLTGAALEEERLPKRIRTRRPREE
ncbi:MAG: helix-turn-helix domain-containing protein [Gemmatimonadales bacterium]